MRASFRSFNIFSLRCRIEQRCFSDKAVVSGMRADYGASSPLSESKIGLTPMPLFEKWFKAAAAHKGVIEPNAMALATVNPATLQPSTRIVLLKDYDAEGFTWFTNYTSRKATELEGNPRAALTFWWPALERQVTSRLFPCIIVAIWRPSLRCISKDRATPFHNCKILVWCDRCV